MIAAILILGWVLISFTQNQAKTPLSVENTEKEYDTADWLTCHNDTYNFSFKYPEDFHVYNGDDGVGPFYDDAKDCAISGTVLRSEQYPNGGTDSDIFSVVITDTPLESDRDVINALILDATYTVYLLGNQKNEISLVIAETLNKK